MRRRDADALGVSRPVRRCPARAAARVQPGGARDTWYGLVRAVALTVVGELDPVPPLTALEVLPLDEAEAALPTSLERALLHDGAALLDG